MVHINNNTILVQATELRTEMPRLTALLPENTVIVMKRGEPMAVLQAFDDFKKQQELLEEYEDYQLGMIAKERMKHAKKGDFIPHDVMMKKLGLK